jgi:uncharacterized protein (TIGR02246 family)
MSEEHDRQQIRDLIANWIEASAAGDLKTLLGLMAEDVVFLRAGHPPMRGREAFAAAARESEGRIRLEGKSDIQEIQISGDYAYCWNHLVITITTTEGDKVQKLAGPVLSVFHREADGRWVLLRDANMLTPA